MVTYRIKPLEWDKEELKGPFSYMQAHTSFGSYRISKTKTGLRWSYCFDEYFDEDYLDCKTIEEGKLEAEEHWQGRLSKCLLKERGLAGKKI